MRNTTIHLPALYLILIKEILEKREYPCTSEFIRIAIRKMLKRDLQLLQNNQIEQNIQGIHKFQVGNCKKGGQRNLEQFNQNLKHLDILKEKKRQQTEDKRTKKQLRLDRHWI
ncbi:MAG: hypothetical protein ACTSRS_15215 [Candidatus Helarchaeota archaeon]